MTRRFLGSVLLAFGIASTGCHSKLHRVRDEGDMILHAQNVDRQFVEAFNKADINNVMDCYWNSPELTVYPPDALEAHGWDNVKAGYMATFKNMPGAKLVLGESRYQVAGDSVIGWGTWTMTIPAAPGTTAPATELHGRFTQVSARQNGKWVYVLDHPSVPLQAPATMPAK